MINSIAVALLLLSSFIVPAANAAPPLAPLLQTGQLTCYNSTGTAIDCTSTGQDGEMRVGLPWPTPRFVDNGDHTIIDKSTGLQWTKNANPAAGDNTYGGYMSWQQALDYIKTLNSQNYLGHNDWRLPNRNELTSLLNAELSDQSVWLSTKGFSNVQQYYWSSSSGTNYKNYAWLVYMYSGSVNIDKKTYSYYVWPVRTEQQNVLTLPKTGQTECYDASGNTISCIDTGQDGEIQAGVVWPIQRFSDNGDQSVTDNLTGLVWTKDGNAPGPAACGPGTSKTWQNTLDYVKCLNVNNYLGKNDWRLPNLNELGSLVNLGQAYSTPWLNSLGFFNAQKIYWSSTTSINSTSAASGIILGSGVVGADYKVVNGFIFSMSKTNNFYVWPVRGGHWNSLNISPESISFSNTIIGGTSVPQTLTITNVNLIGSIQVNDITLTGADSVQYAVAPGGINACSSLTPTLAAGNSCTVQSVFAPTSAGTKLANLHVSYTGAYSSKTIEIPLSGQGITTTPVVTSFIIPSTATSLVVPITMFAATDDTAVTGFCVTETNNPAGCTWRGTAPTSYTFSGVPQAVATSKTLYAFARDASDNVSTGVAASMVITLPDTTPPSISILSTPTSSSDLTVPITVFTANDNVGVTGYCISEATDVSVCTWLASKPTSYTFAFAIPANKTLRAWVRDMAGNMSSPAIASISIVSPPTLTVIFDGIGKGSVHSNPIGIACAGNTCAATFPLDTSVSLLPTASVGSYFSGWSSGCLVTTDNCTLTMSTDTTVTASFNAMPPLRICDSALCYFQTILDAYNASLEGVHVTIQALAVELAENVNLSRNVPVTFKGGFDNSFNVNSDYTIIHGTLTISKGSLTIEKLTVY